mmetsp:Transcript_5815/g.14437  ORF Transcript_5815/g.14437 Transcript_5815/m.14437 type:complete len:216 (+) Transcript_5815:365-1012(+)
MDDFPREEETHHTGGRLFTEARIRYRGFDSDPGPGPSSSPTTVVPCPQTSSSTTTTTTCNSGIPPAPAQSHDITSYERGFRSRANGDRLPLRMSSCPERYLFRQWFDVEGSSVKTVAVSTTRIKFLRMTDRRLRVLRPLRLRLRLLRRWWLLLLRKRLRLGSGTDTEPGRSGKNRAECSECSGPSRSSITGESTSDFSGSSSLASPFLAAGLVPL